MTYYTTALGRSLSALRGAFSPTPYPQLSETPFSDDRRELFRTISAFNDKLQKRLKRLIVKETKMAAQAVDQGDKKQVFNSR